MRTRLRPAPTPDELTAMYPPGKLYDAGRFGAGHGLRVSTTIALGIWAVEALKVDSVVDLSAGNGAIPRSIVGAAHTRGRRLEICLGDLTADPSSGYDYAGPIEVTLAAQIPRPGGLWICSETIEHVDDPDSLLADGASRFGYLLLSTPITNGDDSNPEHLWSWDVEGVDEMLYESGWSSVAAAHLLPGRRVGGYAYQIWVARSAIGRDLP